jgi:hypothetical protein
MKLKSHLSISLSDEGCGCGHWTEVPKFVVCIGAEIAMPAMHEDETTTEHRPRTQTRSKAAASDTHKEQNPLKRKEKKRSERHIGFACTKNLKPNDAKASNVKDACGPVPIDLPLN